MLRCLPLTAALSLTTILGIPAPAVAAPPPEAVAVRGETPDRDRLSDALLGGRELPAGFTPQPDAIDDLFARIAGEITACGKAGGLPETTVYREFVRGAGDEELLVQTVSAPGMKEARAAVAALGGVLPGCTAFTRAAGELPMEMRFALSSYPRAPKIGDATAGIAFVMTVPTLNLAVNGRLLAVAAGAAHTTVLLMTESSPKTADLEAAARTAVGKLAALKQSVPTGDRVAATR
ncbi:hypothetical protein [Actinoplanes utahensis]|uniref:PknH-like extracellular domain-containing protein n=1 Tax=Actinoplanes utahensis TaxID=1869 RepID=A0A0A6U858_ACTUT|nr:hypothetical protein [Actinoplanes utahensis]KHD72225.1 hypothetical protein MB27_42115 [Actinoplanes utahensis]GIF27508.1 hypothetical protein Aut01nite_04940 [Actinoplanes utahensis]